MDIIEVDKHFVEYTAQTRLLWIPTKVFFYLTARDVSWYANKRHFGNHIKSTRLTSRRSKTMPIMLISVGFRQNYHAIFARFEFGYR